MQNKGTHFYRKLNEKVAN